MWQRGTCVCLGRCAKCCVSCSPTDEAEEERWPDTKSIPKKFLGEKYINHGEIYGIAAWHCSATSERVEFD